MSYCSRRLTASSTVAALSSISRMAVVVVISVFPVSWSVGSSAMRSTATASPFSLIPSKGAYGAASAISFCFHVSGSLSSPNPRNARLTVDMERYPLSGAVSTTRAGE